MVYGRYFVSEVVVRYDDGSVLLRKGVCAEGQFHVDEYIRVFHGDKKNPDEVTYANHVRFDSYRFCDGEICRDLGGVLFREEELAIIRRLAEEFKQRVPERQ